MANRALIYAGQGLAHTLGEIGNFAQAMREEPAKEEERQMRLAISRETLAQMKMKRQSVEKEEMDLDAPMEGTVLFNSLTNGWLDTEKQEFKKWAVSSKLMTEDGITSKRNLQKFQFMVATQEELGKKLLSIQRQKNLRELDELQGQLDKMEEKGDVDPVKKDKLIMQIQGKTRQLDDIAKRSEYVTDVHAARKLYEEADKRGLLESNPGLAAMVEAARVSPTPYMVKKVLDGLTKVLEGGKQDTNLTETEMKALPDTDPRKIQWLKTTKELQKDKPERIVDWGYGQKKNLATGEIYEVPTAPRPDISKKDAVNLRKEFDALPEVKEYKQVITRVDAMESTLAKSKGMKNLVAVDQALISLFNKITDPQSVVRESEYARTPENMPVANAITGKMDKWLKGGAGLTNEERTALVTIGKEIGQTYKERYTATAERYKGYAEGMGVSPDEVVPKQTPRERAIEELKKRGKVVNDKTIEKAMELLEAK